MKTLYKVVLCMAASSIVALLVPEVYKVAALVVGWSMGAGIVLNNLIDQVYQKVTK